MNKSEFAILFNKFFSDTLSAEEYTKFRQLVVQSEYESELENLLSGTVESNFPTDLPEEVNLEAMRARLLSGVTKQFSSYPIAHRIHFLKTAWFRYAAAVLIVVCCAYLFTTQKTKSVPKKIATSNDIPAPANNRATLTLSNGQIVFLDTVSNGFLAKQLNADIEKSKSGEIIYHTSGALGEMQYNTLSVPKGSQIASIILSDGSKVYLNAASSIKYPVAFGGRERKVEISGEAYLEIAKDKNKKFIVESKGLITEVLGTSFNISAFSDEEVDAITLLEGKVKISKNSESIILTPGEQVLTNTNSKKLLINHKANLGQVTSWQKGLFIFTDMSLPIILRQVERWYNVSLKYDGVLPSVSYTGGLSRSLPLSEVIKLLQSEKIALNLKGNILTVKPK